MNTDNDGSSSFRRPPLQPKGRRGKKETPIVSLVPDTNLQSQPITVSSIPPPPPTMKKIIKRPMSPRDITPILVNGEPIQSSPVPYLSPPPSSSVEESIPAPAEKDTIFNAEIDEDDHRQHLDNLLFFIWLFFQFFGNQNGRICSNISSNYCHII